MDVISLFTVRTLGRMSNQLGIYKPRTFLLNKFFKWDGMVYGQDITVDIQTDTLAISQYTHPKDEAGAVERPGYKSKTFRLPYFKEKMTATVEQLFTRMPGQPVFSGEFSAAQIAGQLMSRDLVTLANRIDRRSEQMAGEALVTGKIVFKGKGVDGEMDFERSNDTHKVTLTGDDKWDTTTADIVGDLHTMKDLVTDDSGLSANICVMGPAAFLSLLKNSDARELLNNLRIVIGNIQSPEQVELGATRYGDILGMELWVYNQSYIDPIDKTKKAIFPADGVLIGATVDVPLQDNRLYYGMIQDFDNDQAGLPIFNKLDKKADPSSISLIQQCSRSPVLIQPNSTVFYDVQ